MLPPPPRTPRPGSAAGNRPLRTPVPTRDRRQRAVALAKARALDPKPYFPSERKTVRLLAECGLEAGLSHSDAVRLAIGVYKELDVLARATATLAPLPAPAITAIRGYARAILRSGSTFSSFEIATRAIATYREAEAAIAKLGAEWDRQTVTQRLRLQRTRRQATAKMMERHAQERSRVTVAPEESDEPDEPDPEPLAEVWDMEDVYVPDDPLLVEFRNRWAARVESKLPAGGS